MDFVKSMTGGNTQNQQGTTQQTTDTTNQQGSSSGGGFLGGLGNKLNSAAGGGPESEKNEDLLDKGIDMFQEKVLGQGPQDNESAAEQHKDEMISDALRGQWKSTTGSELPIKDKPTKTGI